MSAEQWLSLILTVGVIAAAGLVFYEGWRCWQAGVEAKRARERWRDGR